MRELVFDTETTGFEPGEGHRLVEIGCIELMNKVPTGRSYHQYINPERDMPSEAAAVHGLTEDFLKDKPVFSQIYSEFVEFVGADGILVAHNAAFDMKFINAELKTVGHEGYSNKRVVDTLQIARNKFPGSPASLDALCRRFGIDLSERDFHGALLDAQLLAEVYLELMGGRQHGLALDPAQSKSNSNESAAVQAEQKERVFREPRSFSVSKEELEAHQKMLEELTDPIWRNAS